jgi:mycothiol synthase
VAVIPEPIPEPEQAPGVRWVVPRIEDAPRLADLYDAWAETGGLTWRISAAEIAHEMAGPDAGVATNYRVAEDDRARFVASVVVHPRSAPGLKHRAWLFITSRTEHAHLETIAAAWGTTRAAAAFDAAGGDMPRVVRVNADARNVARIARFEALGFTICRYFLDMIRPLAAPIPQVRAPDGVAILDWDERWVEPSWQAHCDAFADHWGSLPPTIEEWGHRRDDPHFRSDLSVVAVAGGSLVGYALNAVFPHDWTYRSRREGWIEILGTRRAWRRRGIGSALIAESMRRFAADGLDHAALDVDGANPTGAFGIYERLGFAEIDRTVELMKELDQ